MASHKKPMPAWLLGLIIAAVAFGVGLIVFAALGYGDDPAIDPNATAVMISQLGV